MFPDPRRTPTVSDPPWTDASDPVVVAEAVQAFLVWDDRSRTVFLDRDCRAEADRYEVLRLVVLYGEIPEGREVSFEELEALEELELVA